MQTVSFTTEELEVLRELLRAKVDEVEVETFRTDAHDYKEMLKRRREILGHVLAKITALPVAA